MSTTWSGTWHVGHAANNIFNMKNGDQHKTNVKNTKPNTFDAFCSVATAFAAKSRRLLRPARNL